MSFDSVTFVRPYEQIVNQIQDAIRDGRLPRGSRLPTERELSEMFGVSRAVVREAVKVLTGQGLVESRQGSGTFVFSSSAPFVSRTIVLDVPMEAHAIQQLVETREVLDRLSGELAAQRRTAGQAAEIVRIAEASRDAAAVDDLATYTNADRDFHNLVEEACGNVYLTAASHTIRLIQSEMIQVYAAAQGSLLIPADQHLRIARAIESQDARAAGDECVAHARYTGTTLSLIPQRFRHGAPDPDQPSRNDGESGSR